MMDLSKTMRDDPDREMNAGVEPEVTDFYNQSAQNVKRAGLPFLAAKIYGKNPYRFPPVPLNANETGNTKQQDILGQNVRPHTPAKRRTFLDSYGSLGGASSTVTARYSSALSDAERTKLPLMAAQIYNAPAVKLPLQPYDVSTLVPNDRGMVGRIYSNVSAVPAATAATSTTRGFGQKFGQWLQTGEFK